MKKLLEIFAPSILMIISIALMRQNHDILLGIYVVFPLLYIIIGLFSSSKGFLLKLILISVSFVIPINLWFYMGSCIELVFLYSFLAVISYAIKNVISKNKPL